MHLLSHLPLMVAVASAQYIIDSSSFGHTGSISPNQVSIPNWQVTGEGHIPLLYSDKVALTPPYPGNRRGAILAENSVAQSEWIADFEFRATGPERGGGNLQIWYTKEPANIAQSSIYTVGKFDGMVLVIDTYGGKGGGIRGFMNDGSTDYKSAAVDQLAFGHCDYAYRNLGRPSQIQIRQETNAFEVLVDHKRCFWSDKIKLPSGYYFGISAASADTPDSFEAYKFVLSTSTSFAREEPRRMQPPPPPPSAPNTQSQAADTPASSFTTSDAQFDDLHNRLQIIAASVDSLSRELTKLAENSEGRHRELMRNTMSSSGEQLNAMDQRIQSIERSVRDYDSKLSNIQTLLKDSHSSLIEGLPAHMTNIISTKSPRMGVFLFVFIAFQLLLAGSYVVYKRRRANGPKKYL